MHDMSQNIAYAEKSPFPKWDISVKQFLESVDGSEKTRLTYDHALRAFTRWFQNHESPLSIDTIRKYRDSLKQNSTANTVALYLVTLRKFFDYCVGQQIISENPAHGVKSLKKPRGHLRHDLSRTDLRSIFENVDQSNDLGLRDFAMINLMVRNGLRVVEITRANIRDLEVMQGRTILRVRGKGRDALDEFVVLNEITRDVILKYLENKDSEDKNTPLFSSVGIRNSGGRLSTRTVHRRVSYYMEKAGVKTDKVSPHSLRHSFVTLAIEGGATLVEVQAAARHRSLQTTMGYFHEHGRLNDPIEDRIKI
jgi:integrase/recombinase XerC/integrase/recombinase XerD